MVNLSLSIGRWEYHETVAYPHTDRGELRFTSGTANNRDVRLHATPAELDAFADTLRAAAADLRAQQTALAAKKDAVAS